MKVLQVERVIPDLVYVVARKLGFAHLELDREDCCTGNEGRIEAAAETRNVEFQEDGTFDTGECALEQRNLVKPGVPLAGLHSKGAVACDFPKDLLWGSLEKCRYIRRIVGIRCGESGHGFGNLSMSPIMVPTHH